MGIPLRVELKAEQVQELEHIRDQHPKAYLRERASAILKVAAGWTAKAVAEQGLLKRHEPETVSLWVRQYLAEGMKGLIVKPGRGRKAVFFPKVKAGRSDRGQ